MTLADQLRDRPTVSVNIRRMARTLGQPLGRIGRVLTGPRRGEAAIVAAVAITVVLLAVGVAAVRHAAVRHRRTADEALDDQASYLAGMIAATVQQQGWFAARTLLRTWSGVLDTGRPWPSTDSIRRLATAEAIGPDLPALAISRFFVGQAGSWRSSDQVTAHDDDALSRATRAAPSDSSNFRMTVVPRGRDTSLVFFMASPARDRAAAWYGFETPIAAFRDKIVKPRIIDLAYSFRWLKDSLRERPTAADSLPPLAISLVTADGRVLYATPDRPHWPWLGSREISGGLASKLTVSLEPAAVPVLMSGGYPTDATPIVLAIFGFGVLLLLLAARLAWRALALSRQREEFTSSVSHELRTPLTNIQLFAETLLLDRARTPEERRRALETITRETRRLVHMVENVLAISRVGRTAAVLVRRPERIDQLLDDVIDSFGPLLQSRQTQVRVSLDGSPTAHIDGDAVRRILVNLIDNAIRYGPPGQTLDVAALHRDGTVQLSVEDEGPGVPAADRGLVWRPFVRGSTAVETGTGIGLAVVQQLVTLHGGEARVEDGARGARFVVVLPAPD